MHEYNIKCIAFEKWIFLSIKSAMHNLNPHWLTLLVDWVTIVWCGYLEPIQNHSKQTITSVACDTNFVYFQLKRIYPILEVASTFNIYTQTARMWWSVNCQENFQLYLRRFQNKQKLKCRAHVLLNYIFGAAKSTLYRIVEVLKVVNCLEIDMLQVYSGICLVYNTCKVD